MKKVFILITLVGSTLIGSEIYAQQNPPPGSGDKDMRDTGVKSRSIELERLDREAKKNEAAGTVPPAAQPEDRLAAKFDEIKHNYGQIQLSQADIIKAYQGSGKADYAEISKSALEIGASAARLKIDLFSAPPVEKPVVKDAEEEKDSNKEPIKTTKSLRDLIVDLDNAVGDFTTSAMFQNLRVVDASVAEKAQADLEKIIERSATLDSEARKMAAGVKK